MYAKNCAENNSNILHNTVTRKEKHVFINVFLSFVSLELPLVKSDAGRQKARSGILRVP